MAAIEIGIIHTASPHLYAARVHKAFAQKDYKIALSDANYLIKYGYDDAEVFYLRSKIYLENGQLQEALQDMQSANTLSPGNSRYLMHNARLYFFSMEFDVANTLYSRALKRGQVPDSTDALCYLYCHLRQVQPDENAISEIIRYHPKLPNLYKIIIESPYGYPDTALHYLDQAIERFPEEIDFYSYRAQLRWEKNHEDPQVKMDYYRLVDLQPDTILWHKKLHTYVVYRNSKEAVEIRKRARAEMHKRVEEDSNSAANWYQLALAYDLLDFTLETPAMKRKAITYYSEAIARDSAFYLAYYHRASLEKWVNEDSDAYLRDMRMALVLNEHWHYRQSIAWELSHMDRDGEAIEEISQAINLYPYNAFLYDTRARFYDKVKEHEKAENDRIKSEELRSPCEDCPPPPPYIPMD